MKKKKPVKGNKIYIFGILLEHNNPHSQVRKEVWRDIAILDDQNLYQFAEAIVDAFGFEFDHCFGFFDNLKRWVDSKIKYELFADLKNQSIESVDSKSVKKTKIQQVFKNKGDKMLFLFDYGDNWEFIVQLKNIDEPDFKKSYPQVIKSIGQAPEQYQLFEGDEE